jgi:hypothetical protein
MAFNEANVRARILTVIKSVDDYGNAYDYARWLNDWNNLRTLFKTEIDNVAQLRGWTIELADIEQTIETFGVHGDGSVQVDYVYRIRGLMSLDDSEGTEKTFVAHALAVVAALDADSKLHTANYEDGANSNFVSEACSRAPFDHRMFAGVLCHVTEITKRVSEMV